MKLSFSPMRRDDALTVIKADDVLTINGDAFDFSSLPDGATIPASEIPCEWIVGAVERIEGVLHVTLIYPHGPDPSEAVAFPQPIENPADGYIPLPEYEDTTDVDA
jgi:hypothetical protein